MVMAFAEGAVRVLHGKKNPAGWNIAPYFKQRIYNDYFSTDKYLIFKSSLISRDFHFPSLQKCAWLSSLQTQTYENSQEVWAFPTCGRNTSACWISSSNPVAPSHMQLGRAMRLVLTNGQGA